MATVVVIIQTTLTMEAAELLTMEVEAAHIVTHHTETEKEKEKEEDLDLLTTKDVQDLHIMKREEEDRVLHHTEALQGEEEETAEVHQEEEADLLQDDDENPTKLDDNLGRIRFNSFNLI